MSVWEWVVIAAIAKIASVEDRAGYASAVEGPGVQYRYCRSEGFSRLEIKDVDP